jgi:ribosomal protein L18E
MPLYRRIARRGFSNYPFKVQYAPVNVDVLSSAFENGAEVTLDSLKERGLIGRGVTDVKVLGRGECTVKLTVRGLSVSAGARAKIEAAGGSVVDDVTESAEAAETQAPAPRKKAAKKTVEEAETDDAPKAEVAKTDDAADDTQKGSSEEG